MDGRWYIGLGALVAYPYFQTLREGESAESPREFMPLKPSD